MLAYCLEKNQELGAWRVGKVLLGLGKKISGLRLGIGAAVIIEFRVRLDPLKKAYAEIILNTDKEAAARIMVSERKALRYQQELFASKDESLRMLLRLRQIFDAKANDAEMMSLNQQKIIEVLEAQLGEAEDIVRDLRAELRETQDELEKLSKDLIFPDAQTNLLTVSDVKSSVLTGTNVGNTCSCVDNCYVYNPDFASIVMRRKEPDLYRNGCAHRIRAFERCLMNENFSLFGQVDETKNDNTQEGEEAKTMHSILGIGFAESLGDPTCKTDLDMVDVSAVNSDAKVSEITERSSPQPVNNKFLVYAFERKRKNDCSSSLDRDCSHDDGIL
ncbi:microtubule-associated protein TORTIFOLIA1-like isoform X1 [Hibiscus syriacus]|uniref:Microtubule-associated protein TORTIFOLIA1-like isoform X1 n=1 Tax=Hibiscus syriacus TaxID=106335 RepID=A0A6A2ZTH6_HIBSY|nr:microtubule-associated protein TORTIFOLIA1-like isoform X1 [Hibiscus syriacus]